MMVSLMLDSEFDVLPTHVKHRDNLAVSAVDGDLGLRPRISGLDQQQP
jgi:hypothetical protein